MAEVLRFEYDQALKMGHAVLGLNAWSKEGSLGLLQTTPKEVQEQCQKMPIFWKALGKGFISPEPCALSAKMISRKRRCRPLVS